MQHTDDGLGMALGKLFVDKTFAQSSYSEVSLLFSLSLVQILIVDLRVLPFQQVLLRTSSTFLFPCDDISQNSNVAASLHLSIKWSKI